jgi:hypothetical protein
VEIIVSAQRWQRVHARNRLSPEGLGCQKSEKTRNGAADSGRGDQQSRFRNEKRVLEAIERRRGEFTVVLIEHRLSTIRRAELIYVVEGGRVVESGDWSSLSVLRGGRFLGLWSRKA